MKLRIKQINSTFYVEGLIKFFFGIKRRWAVLNIKGKEHILSNYSKDNNMAAYSTLDEARAFARSIKRPIVRYYEIATWDYPQKGGKPTMNANGFASSIFLKKNKLNKEEVIKLMDGYSKYILDQTATNH